MANKKGDMSVGVIIALVLGVVVLVVLALGFSMGWDKLVPWLSSKNNVQDMVSQCQVACASGNTYGYCTQKRTLNAEDLSGGKLENTDCKTLAASYSKYGISSCPTISCPP
jgi:hypothetical protein